MKSIIVKPIDKDPILISIFTYIGRNSDDNIFNDVEDFISDVCNLECKCLRDITLMLGCK